MSTKRSATITLWLTRVMFFLVLLLLFTMPAILRWDHSFRSLSPAAGMAILVAFYLCAPGVLYALYSIGSLLRRILAGQVFVGANVSALRRLRWCCAWVCLVCLPAAFFYPPLCFMTMLMGFLALTVSVVKNVMAAAVELREENDLTV